LNFPTQTGTRSFLARPLAVCAIVATMVAGGIPMSQPAVAQDSDSIAAYLPDDSVVVVEVELDPDSSQAILAGELIERANLGALLPESDQAMLEDTMVMAQDSIDGDMALFVSPAIAKGFSVDRLAEDASTLADDPFGMTSQIPSGWGVVVRPSDPESFYDTVVESFSMSATSTTFPEEATPAATEPYETDEYEGFEILFTPATEYGPGTAVALVDEVVVLGTVADDIEAVIDVVTGTAEAMADNDAFGEIRSGLPEETLVSGFINGPVLALLVGSIDEVSLAGVTADMLASLAAYQGFAMYADDPGFRVDTIAIPAPGTALPVPDAYDPSFASTMPAESLVFGGGTNLGANANLDALALLFAAEMGGVSPDDMGTPVDPEEITEQVFADAEEFLGFNIQTDLLDQLSGEWAVAGTTDLSSGSALLLSEVEDPEVVAEVVAEVTELLEENSDDSFTLSSRTAAGAEVTVIEADADGIPLTIEFGVIADVLAVGINGWLDLVGTPPADALADAPRFEEALGHLPTDVTSVAYVDLSAVLPMVVDLSTAFAMTSVVDADPSCAEYASQEEAQAAYDDDTFEYYLLDLDWDGEACEDFFAPATPQANDAVETVNVQSAAVVTWAEDGRTGSSAILVIGE